MVSTIALASDSAKFAFALRTLELWTAQEVRGSSPSGLCNDDLKLKAYASASRLSSRRRSLPAPLKPALTPAFANAAPSTMPTAVSPSW